MISAVITADIVNSTLLPAGKNRGLKRSIVVILGNNRYEFYRGDSFQALIRRPEEAFTILLRLRTEARKISAANDIRASIGIGSVSPDPESLSASTGEAFILSGRAMDSLHETKSRLTIHSTDTQTNNGLRVIAYFADYIVQRMTEKQAGVIAELLKGFTQTAAAVKLDKSLSTINKHAQSAGWDELVRLQNDYRLIISAYLAKRKI